jgi:hypothetical protein
VKFDQPLFSSFSKKLFDEDSQIIFVSDLFADDYIGGAELTLQALMDATPVPVNRLHSSEVTAEHIKNASK